MSINKECNCKRVLVMPKIANQAKVLMFLRNQTTNAQIASEYYDDTQTLILTGVQLIETIDEEEY